MMAGVVDFDPEKWSQAHSDNGAAEPAKVAKVAKVGPALAGLASLAGAACLPADLVDGLAELRSCPAPRITRPEVWPVVVADALRLADDGWASQALGLGWGPVDIWGCSPDVGGNPDHDGLAVWLAGRRVLLLDERTCIVEAGPVARSVFTRRQPPPAGAVFLWELGKGARRGGS